MANLRREAVTGHAELVGDVMVDVAAAVQPRARERTDLVRALGLQPGDYVLATAHRAGNVDDPVRLGQLVSPADLAPAAGPAAAASANRGTAALAPECSSGFAPRRDQALPAARVSRADRAAVQRQGGPDRLRRTPEGGLPGQCPLRHHASEHRVDGDRRAGLECARRPRSGGGPSGAGTQAPSAHPELYGDGRAGERVVAALTLLSR